MQNPISDALDVRLMRTLLILLTECNVSKTAELLEQPQPSISLALKRLRHILNDPLLVRDGNRFIPTDRAIEIRGVIQELLDKIDEKLLHNRQFDPSTADQRFSLFVSNCFGSTFIPQLIGRLRDLAPGIKIDINPMPKLENLAPLIASGSTDLILGNWPNPPGHLRASSLFQSEIVCLVHRQHPFSAEGNLTMDQYLSSHHLVLTPNEDLSMSPIDSRLATLGVTREAPVGTPDYSSVPYILARSDLVFTTGRHFAESMTNLFPLSIIVAPIELGTLGYCMLWHDRKHRSAAHRWLREVVKSVADDFAANPALQVGAERSSMQSLSRH